MNWGKLHSIEAEAARIADARRAAGERASEHRARSKELRSQAVFNAHPDLETMSLDELLAIDDAELTEGGVDLKQLKRAALELRLAEEARKFSPKDEAEFAALSTLARNCREYAGNE